ncbi:MAG: Dihydroorotate dehydrogenase, electron transfer subunit, iron-sulfur cluster binding domain protein [Solirubrobacterales bacterium]|jgi:dihydroorotate dehydrogenase electron transfer subunit|nr:Dihydroorotate dehydrogenase, electron transfer subunit, iron-sulfur cluster binding domain protein [Solirubrobacterales bacterium]
MSADRRTLAPFGRRRVPIVDRCEYGSYVVLRCLDEAGPAPRPGQFYMLAAAEAWGGGEGERPFLPRAFSVLRATPESELHFLLEAVGPGTKRLGALAEGEELWLAGPFGVGFAPPAEQRRPLLVGGGVGIAPLAIWQDELGLDATVLLGFRDAAHAEGAAVLAEARLATDDGSVGHRGLVTDLLIQELDHTDDARAAVYACGPPPMLEAVRALCAERGVPAQLALESGMACGYGACFGCVVPTRAGYVRLCLEGPVLDAELLETALIPGTGHG